MTADPGRDVETLKTTSDEQLLESYAQGDGRAFEQFFTRHRGRVYHYALKKMGRPELAAEVTQEVFVKLHAKIHHYRFNESALAWFFSIVHNACIDELRKNAKAGRAFVGNSSDGAHERQANLSSESSENDETWESGFLGHSLDQLSSEQRHVIQQRILDDKSFRQISAETGKSEVALRKSYSRAVEKLKTWLLAQKRDKK